MSGRTSAAPLWPPAGGGPGPVTGAKPDPPRPKTARLRHRFRLPTAKD